MPKPLNTQISMLPELNSKGHRKLGHFIRSGDVANLHPTPPAKNKNGAQAWWLCRNGAQAQDSRENGSNVSELQASVRVHERQVNEAGRLHALCNLAFFGLRDGEPSLALGYAQDILQVGPALLPSDFGRVVHASPLSGMQSVYGPILRVMSRVAVVLLIPPRDLNNFALRHAIVLVASQSLILID